MNDFRLRIYALTYFFLEIVYSIMFVLLRYRDMTFLSRPTSFVEIATVVVFILFAIRAFDGLKLKWLWVIVAFAAETLLPATVTYAVTKKLFEVQADPYAWYLASAGTFSMKVAVPALILAWISGRAQPPATDLHSRQTS